MIFNYSFAPISEFMKSVGVVDIEDQELFHLLDFDYTPTIQEITKRCRKIVDHAISNNHNKIYLKNYATFHTHLIQEFQSQDIRIFVPEYETMDSEEYITSYKVYNKMAYLSEVGLVELDSCSGLFVEYLNHNESVFMFRSSRSEISIDIDRSIIDEVRTNNIYYLISSKYNISISNMDEFIIDFRVQFNSELLNTCTDLDSQFVSKFLNFCNQMQAKFRTYDSKTADDFELTLDEYELIPISFKTTVNMLLTSKYNKLNIYRNIHSFFNLPSLYRRLGFYNSLVSNYHKSNEYISKYLDIIEANLYEDDVIFHPRRNLIRNLISSNQFKKAEVFILELLDNCNEIQYQFIYQDLANVYRLTGRNDEATKIYNKLIELDSLEFRHIYYTQLAIIYSQMGKGERALEIIEKSIKPKLIKNTITAAQHVLIHFDHHNKLPNLEPLRATKLTDFQIDQQLEFFETMEKFISDNEYYAEAFSEFLDMPSSDIPYNYICFFLLFKYYFRVKNYIRIFEMIERIESQLRGELRENIKQARIYLKNESYEELERLFAVRLINYLY